MAKEVRVDRGVEVFMINKRASASVDPKLTVGNFDTVVVDPLDQNSKTLQEDTIANIAKQKKCTILEISQGEIATLLIDKYFFGESGLQDAFDQLFYDYTNDAQDMEAVRNLKNLIQRASKYGIQMSFLRQNIDQNTQQGERFRSHREEGFTRKLSGKTVAELAKLTGHKKIIELKKQHELETLAKLYHGLCHRFGHTETTDIFGEIVWQSFLLFQKIKLPDFADLRKN